MADLRMAVAKARYLTQFAHSISCQNCLNRRECNLTARATSPPPANIIAAMRNRIRPTGSTANTGLVIDSAGVLRPATGLEMRSGSADVGSMDSELDASSSNFAYLLDRIPPPLREFFGATDASTTHTEFSVSSSGNLLFNSSLYDGTTNSQASDTFMESRANSVMSMPSLHTASQFSRATSSNSFRLARGISLMNADESSNPPISLVPNNVFDAHHVPLENFRQATSLMSMALSTLDLVDIPDTFDARNGDELLNISAMDAEDTISVADARRLIFSRGVNALASNSDTMSGSAAASAMARYQLSRGTSFQSVKSSDELTFEQI
ncbi:hypothetical protein BJ741DRAFT_599251 [Chytriomyces cf. hyalinus JEL632]|nr:hypothetical protein BJ741DRAFT_599251 [Chytriomyces cf. hyalinus JEL632]